MIKPVPDQQIPAGPQIDANKLIDRLSNQIAALNVELAMMQLRIEDLEEQLKESGGDK